MTRVVAVALLALSCLAAPVTAADASRIALVSLCDPAKIATLEGDRAANPRVRKIAYWLEVARQNGRDPKAEMDAVMTQLGWGGTAKGELTAAAMARNRAIAERLGCLDAEGRAGLGLTADDVLCLNCGCCELRGRLRLNCRALGRSI